MKMVETMGQRIRRMREAMGLTAFQMSEKVGMSQPNYSRWENDNITRLIPERAAAIAKVLNITVEELVGIVDPLTQYDDAIKDWIATPVAKDWVNRAYADYVKFTYGSK